MFIVGSFFAAQACCFVFFFPLKLWAMRDIVSEASAIKH